MEVVGRGMLDQRGLGQAEIDEAYQPRVWPTIYKWFSS